MDAPGTALPTESFRASVAGGTKMVDFHNPLPVWNAIGMAIFAFWIGVGIIVATIVQA